MLEILKDSMRRLTADYTEEEYREYLEESPIEEKKTIKLNDEMKDTLKKLQRMIEGALKFSMWKDEHGFSDLKFNSMQDIRDAISELSEATGYEVEFLCDTLEEILHDEYADENTYEEAFDTVMTISYEHDW